MARLRLTLLAALTLAACLCLSAGAFASGAARRHRLLHGTSVSKAPAHHRATRRSRALKRAARCRRYARKHPHLHVRCAKPRGLHPKHPSATHTHREGTPKRATHRLAPARAGSCPGADLTPNADNLDSIRSATLCLINQERGAHSEPALQVNSKLQQAAQGHTTDMAFGNYFDHNSPHGDTPLSRMRSSGYIYSSRLGYAIGENIAWGTLSLSTPRAIVHAWINSPEHLANILNARFHDTAIGVSPHVPGSLAHGQPGGIYTQDFGVIITG